MRQNINCSIEESILRFREVTDQAKHHNIPIRGYLSCVVGCPYQGPVAPSEVARVAEMLMELGCHELSLGDTIGVGTPARTIAMLQAVKYVVPKEQLAVHFHDTYGQALVNILVSLEQGITTIDSSVAGLGGCPYAKGASGNVATEDLVYMLDGLGIDTGIDIDKLVDAGEFICSVLGRESRSKAGLALAAKRRDS
jgi:hydroxymethylglutaryl-CoA lyase